MALLGCSESSQQEETQVAQTEEQTAATDDRQPQGDGRPNYIPPANPYGRLGPAAMDTLRMLKKKHGISRDEYWENKGGVLANDYFEVWYPVGRMAVSHGMRVFNEIMPARETFEAFFGRVPQERVVIRLPSYLEQYKAWTGREWWFYSDIRADTLTLQPIFILVKRGLAHIAVPHEYHQWAIGRMTNYGAPRWLEEGIASYLAKEGKLLAGQILEFPEEARVMSPAQVEDILVKEETRQDSRIAYYHSFRMVKGIVDRYGEDKLKAMVLALADGQSLDEACQKAFNVSEKEMLGLVADHKLDT
jgi:hypothetical protein